MVGMAWRGVSVVRCLGSGWRCFYYPRVSSLWNTLLSVHAALETITPRFRILRFYYPFDNARSAARDVKIVLV